MTPAVSSDAGMHDALLGARVKNSEHAEAILTSANEDGLPMCLGCRQMFLWPRDLDGHVCRYPLWWED
jgi:hypothetical protein